MAGAFVLVLDPRKLSNPDADLRYLVPDAIDQKSGGLVEGDGYTYGNGNCMHIYFRAIDRELGLAAILHVLSLNEFKGNNLFGCATIAFREGSVGGYTVVHPSNRLGEFIPEAEA